MTSTADQELRVDALWRARDFLTEHLGPEDVDLDDLLIVADWIHTGRASLALTWEDVRANRPDPPHFRAA